jgi:hypothetical protein
MTGLADYTVRVSEQGEGAFVYELRSPEDELIPGPALMTWETRELAEEHAVAEAQAHLALQRRLDDEEIIDVASLARRVNEREAEDDGDD